jgi:hypothetical protein
MRSVPGFLLLLLLNINVATAALPRLQVSENGRFLITSEAKPFFWMGDTAWQIFQKASREDSSQQPSVKNYFESRQRNGFNVVQASLTYGEKTSDVYGNDAFVNDDFSRPRTLPGPNNDYWDMADYLIEMGEKHNLYMALLPVWLNSVKESHPMTNDPLIAYRYGHFLGNRYRTKSHIIWVLGGDPYEEGRDVDNPKVLKLVRAMAEGIADGVNGEDAFDQKANYKTLIQTYHPPGGGRSSSYYLHNEPWLDFNMIQTTSRRSFINWFNILQDYLMQPAKPTFDSEVAYEYSFSLDREYESQLPRISDWDVRRAAYWSVFAGGCGYSYGHRSFISWTRKGEENVHGANIPWNESLEAPGAKQMKHLKSLMESRPYLTRIPDQNLVSVGVRGGNDYVMATRSTDGSYAFLYYPTGGSVDVRLNWMRAKRFRAWWYDPRTGEAKEIGEFPHKSNMRFFPPTKGEKEDWVLVLDDVSKNFGVPGRSR